MVEKRSKAVDMEQVKVLTHCVWNVVARNFQSLDRLPDGTCQVENVKLLDRFGSKKTLVGTLYLTSSHLIFVDPEGKKEIWISHMHIGGVEKLASTGSGFPLQIRCKNFLNVTFVVPRERDCLDIQSSLFSLSQPASLEDLYAFLYTASDLDSSKKFDGWNLFDLQSEYLRMGVPNENWLLSRSNENYELCDTYPSHIYIPSTASTPIIISSAKFRSRGRLPVLSYLHHNQAAICRCSQPLSGFSARCVEDESLLGAIRKANPSSKFMYVVDTRPKINAMANRAAGKGYENENFYSNTRFHFSGIENIHVMRASLQKLVEVCELQNPSMSAFLGGLESSGWLKHVKSIIDASVFIAKAIQDGTSVLVHCSDGWDRTAQTCSLSSLMLDPYYRTIEGFQILIEKEWLAFGHKFTDRCRFIASVDMKESSPVFTQFIECVWQLMQQFPTAFQFNERYLLVLHDHVFSCQFGTFIGCCQKDRIDLRLSERTYSLWGYFSKYTTDMTNPFYKKDLQLTMPVIVPVTNPQSYKFWRNMYCRFEGGIHPRENLSEVVSMLIDHSQSLADHKKLLEKRIRAVSKQLGYSAGADSLALALQNLSSSDSMDFRSLLLNENNDDSLPVTKNLMQSSTTHSATENGSGAGKGDERHEGETEDEGCVPIEQLLAELTSVATEWKSLRTAVSCSCAMPFEQHNQKHHCWRCGSIFCVRCIDRYVHLAGHDSSRQSPICKACYKDLKYSPTPSVDDFQKLQEQLAS